MRRFILALVLGAFSVGTNAAIIREDLVGLASPAREINFDEFGIPNETFFIKEQYSSLGITIEAFSSGSGTTDVGLVQRSNGSLKNYGTNLSNGSHPVSFIFDQVQTEATVAVHLGNSGTWRIEALLNGQIVETIDGTSSCGAGFCFYYYGFTETLLDQIRLVKTKNFLGHINFHQVQLGAVPIPGAAWLFASALGLLGWMHRRAN